MSNIFVLIGKSATGKDTLYQELMEVKELSLKKIVSYTTRPIRSGETDGVAYHFIDEAGMNQLIEEGKVVEHRSYQTIHGTWNYFTVDDGRLDLETTDYLLIMTLQGFEQLRSYYGKSIVIPIYIEVSDKERLHRALRREDRQEQPKYAELCRRFLADEEDFSEKNINRLDIHKRYYNMNKGSCIKKIVKDMKRHIAFRKKRKTPDSQSSTL